MRQIGQLKNKQQATLFTDFLLSQGIRSTAEEDQETWVIWVRDEDDLQTARDALTSFQTDPGHNRYQDAQADARRLRQEQQQKLAERQRANIDVRREVWATPLPKRVPLTVALISICIGVALLSGLGQRHLSSPMRELSFCDRANLADISFDESRNGWIDIKKGEVWRLITPIFIHYGPAHILFNLLVFYPMATMIETRRSSLMLGLLVLVIALLSNVGQFVWEGSPWFGGMSGVVYGLFGFVWVRMLMHPNEGFRVQSQTIVMLVAFLVLGFTGTLKLIFGVDVANWAHLFGLLAGMGMATILPAKKKKKRPRVAAP